MVKLSDLYNSLRVYIKNVGKPYNAADYNSTVGWGDGMFP